MTSPWKLLQQHFHCGFYKSPPLNPVSMNHGCFCKKAELCHFKFANFPAEKWQNWKIQRSLNLCYSLPLGTAPNHFHSPPKTYLGGPLESLEQKMGRREMGDFDSIGEHLPRQHGHIDWICYPSPSSQGPPYDLEVRKPMKLPAFVVQISVGCFDIPTPKKTALNPLVSWWSQKKTCLQNSCIKSFNPLIGPKKTVWNGPSSPFPSPGLPGVFVGVTLPETNILYPSKISYSKWNFHLPTIDPQGASC